MMLAGLDRVEWKKLKHAYGKATDIPDLLRTFAAGDARARADAAFKLGAALCHQGTLFDATVEAVPFLFALASAKDVGDKHLLLHLLANIATADDHTPLLLGGIREPEKWPKKRDVFMRSFLAVRDGAKAALPLLGHAEPRTRAEAAFLLAWFEAHAEESAPALAAQASKEKVADVRATLLASLGFVAGYLETEDHDALFRRALGAKEPVLRAAGALALSTARSGEVDDRTFDAIAEAAAAPAEIVSENVPFCGGNLSAFAVRVLAALSDGDEARLGRMTDVVERGRAASKFAAQVVLRALFAPVSARPARAPRVRNAETSDRTRRRDAWMDGALAAVRTKPSDLTPPQDRVLRALARRAEPWDRDLAAALEERGLPKQRELLGRLLGERSAASLLDDAIVIAKKTTSVAEVLLAAADAPEETRRAKARAIAAAVPPERAVEIAVAAYVELEGPNVYRLASEIVAASTPASEAALRRVAQQLATEGPPQRPDANGNIVTFTPLLPIVGVGLALCARARGETVDAHVDALLQAVYGFDPLVRDALAALPPARREAWLLDPKRDDRAQPAEDFKGAWPYWAPYPSKAITERVLAHVATWKKKDPWGGARKDHADPLLREYAASLRTTGNDADAKRCEAALAALK